MQSSVSDIQINSRGFGINIILRVASGNLVAQKLEIELLTTTLNGWYW